MSEFPIFWCSFMLDVPERLVFLNMHHKWVFFVNGEMATNCTYIEEKCEKSKL